MVDDWTSALRQLTRKPPEEGVNNAVINVMRGSDTDRAAALVMASLVDTILGSAIAYALKLNQNATRRLLLHTGPLATFEAREVMVSALGLIGEETRENLVAIRRIRNCFAHAMSDINFNSPEIVRACNRLKLADKWQFFADQAQEKKTRYKFGYACHTIYHGFMHFIGIDFARGIPPQRTLPDSPILP